MEIETAEKLLGEISFNEAGARTPRMALLARQAPLPSASSFNEAGARTPRMGPTRKRGANGTLAPLQ